ncbi:MAG: hypothetical protein NUV97_00535, partial [archaeon]|nr:hypothetical protein [archaeon]
AYSAQLSRGMAERAVDTVITQGLTGILNPASRPAAAPQPQSYRTPEGQRALEIAESQLAGHSLTPEEVSFLEGLQAARDPLAAQNREQARLKREANQITEGDLVARRFIDTNGNNHVDEGEVIRAVRGPVDIDREKLGVQFLVSSKFVVGPVVYTLIRPDGKEDGFIEEDSNGVVISFKDSDPLGVWTICSDFKNDHDEIKVEIYRSSRLGK